MPITLELLVDARHVKEIEAKLKEPGFWDNVIKDTHISRAEQNGGPWPACESECSDDEVAEDCLLSKEDVTVHHCYYCRVKDNSEGFNRCQICERYTCRKHCWTAQDAQIVHCWLVDDATKEKDTVLACRLCAETLERIDSSDNEDSDSDADCVSSDTN